MPFQNPQPNVTYDGGQRSPVEISNDATAERRAAQVRYALSQRAQPQMVTTINPASEQELARQRNGRIRLPSDTPAGYRSQLEAIAQEQEDVRVRLESHRRQATAALREGRMTDAKSHRSRSEDAALELARMAILQQDAETGLAAAEAREEQDRNTLRAQIPAAEKTLLRHLKALQAYPEHAQALADMVAGEAEAEAAHRLLQEAALRLPGERAAPPPFPRGKDGRALRVSVTIPGFCAPPARRPTEADAYER